MWMRPVPDEDRTRVVIPASLATSIGLCAAGTLVIGIAPNLIARFSDLANFLS
jgi:hypothetical protein